MKLRTNSTNLITTNANHKSNSSSQEIYENLMRNEDKNDSMSYEFFENFSKNSNISNIIPYEMCYNITCIQLCCPLGDRLVDNKCFSDGNDYIPHGYTKNNKKMDELFQLTVYDPCSQFERFDRILLPIDHLHDYMIFTNGSLYLSSLKKLIESTSYCFAVVDEGNEYEVTICSVIADEIVSMINDIKTIHVSFYIVSIPFLVAIFLVYSILPDLRNTHGFLLRNYSGALSISYIIHAIVFLIKADDVHYCFCITIAFFDYFDLLASIFWLNVMSFDMWWTFRTFNSLQRSVRQQRKRKLMFYVIFAYGLSFIFAINSVIMEYVSEYLPEILRPGFLAGDCWFSGRGTYALYYYGIKSICVFSSICLSISTALKIARYEKEAGNRLNLTDSESKRFNDNKKWFNMYLKLFILQFIVMGLKWSIATASWLFEDYMSNYVSYIINSMDVMQNICVFIIFVWKNKIKRLLLKQFGCDVSKSSTRKEYIDMHHQVRKNSVQEKTSSSKQGNCQTKSSSQGIEL
ncbi:G-protein coupled receptor Mth2-like isoform X2 [Cataglyphis hispanica]|nr:G-protein coupled receptor Mth2-like isoform X2 [Cataglyphis hispanica]XP_050447597.1 G-protein coupled receptor Mth2-like isoform X2 [Cataglyphis hispanica]XP_050447599.1 G-protein coupled receptor Mth2-like isoform X2 [Cataglyphis hispanica]XP_050447600.1 G-protein coupled receptor Mth2-like isoform X2 [Cataglyphis hispanica]